MKYTILILQSLFIFNQAHSQEEPRSKLTLVVETGHSENITDFDISPNGKYLVTADSKKTIVWERETQKQVKTLMTEGDVSVSFYGNTDILIRRKKRQFPKNLPYDSLSVWNLYSNLICSVDSFPKMRPRYSDVRRGIAPDSAVANISWEKEKLGGRLSEWGLEGFFLRGETSIWIDTLIDERIIFLYDYPPSYIFDPATGLIDSISSPSGRREIMYFDRQRNEFFFSTGNTLESFDVRTGASISEYMPKQEKVTPIDIDIDEGALSYVSFPTWNKKDVGSSISFLGPDRNKKKWNVINFKADSLAYQAEIDYVFSFHSGDEIFFVNKDNTFTMPSGTADPVIRFKHPSFKKNDDMFLAWHDDQILSAADSTFEERELQAPTEVHDVCFNNGYYYYIEGDRSLNWIDDNGEVYHFPKADTVVERHLVYSGELTSYTVGVSEFHETIYLDDVNFDGESYLVNERYTLGSDWVTPSFRFTEQEFTVIKREARIKEEILARSFRFEKIFKPTAKNYLFAKVQVSVENEFLNSVWSGGWVINSYDVSTDGVVSASEESYGEESHLYVYDITNSTPVLHKSMRGDFRIISDSVAAAYSDSVVQFYSLPDLNLMFTVDAKVFDYQRSEWDFGDLKKRIFLTKDGRFLCFGKGDSQIEIYDITRAKIVLSIYVFGDGKWLAVNPDFLFDCSPQLLESIYFESGLELIEAWQLKDRFYEPGLLQKVLGFSKEPLRDSNGLDEIELYPEIYLGHPQNNDGKLVVSLKSRGGGYGPVRIHINRKEVSSDARGAGFDQLSDSISFTYDISNHPYLRPGELNTIEVSAFNAEGYLVSKWKRLYYFADGKKEDHVPVLHAVIVGSADYSGNQLDLSFPAKDALAFASALEISSKNLLGVNKTNFKILTTEGQIDRWPKKENIRNAYKEIAKIAQPSDIVVLYFAGHGINFGGQDGDFYYLTASASSGNLNDPSIRKTVAISSMELTEWLKEIPALKQVLVLDACHSGKFAEDLLTKREIRNSTEIRSLERMKDRTGMYILSGSAADAASYEASVYGQGLLTYSLLFGMKGASLRDGKFVDVVQLFQYAADKVPELARNIGGIQKPELRIPYNAGSFDLGVLYEEDKESIDLPSPKPLFVRSMFQNQSTFDDDLGLSDSMNEQLRSLQVNSSELIFIDVSKFTNAYSVRGSYFKDNGKITLKFNILKDGQIVKSAEVKGIDSMEMISNIKQFLPLNSAHIDAK